VGGGVVVVRGWCVGCVLVEGRVLGWYGGGWVFWLLFGVVFRGFGVVCVVCVGGVCAGGRFSGVWDGWLGWVGVGGCVWGWVL